MLIHCRAEIALEQEEPVAAIRQLVSLLRRGATSTDRASVDLNLVTTSARGRQVVAEFQPQRTRGVAFEQALAVVEELAALPPTKLKSLHIMAKVGGFRWQGSRAGDEAQLALLDSKSLQRKQRFIFCATLSFASDTAEAPFIADMLHEIEREAGIRFELRSSQMQFSQDESGRATADELLLTALTWNELVESVGQQVRARISLADEPHLMSSSAAISFNTELAQSGKAVRVDFTRIVRRWLKQEFAQYSTEGGELGYFFRNVAPGVLAGFALDKRDRPFSKKFTIWIAAGLTSKRFTPAADRPMRLGISLFQLFGIGPLPLMWTYETPQDLEESLASAARVLKGALAIFEREVACLDTAYGRKLAEFAGPRQLSARQAYGVACEVARRWAPDASLTLMHTHLVAAVVIAETSQVVPALDDKGQLTGHGAWCLRFHSKTKQENLQVTVPCYGSVTHVRQDAPSGRQWPSDVDQILPEGWMDSDRAARRALAAAQTKDAGLTAQNVGQFELSSRANPKATSVLPPAWPMRDGMFVMETAWRIMFSRAGDGKRGIVYVSVPADGEGAPAVEVQGIS